MTMTDEARLLQMKNEEEELRFPAFDADTALALGVALIDEARRSGKAVTVDITRAGHRLFLHAMEGTYPENEDWIRRKNNTVGRFAKSSWHTALLLRGENKTLETDYGLSGGDYVLAGGAFPLIVAGEGQIGTITVSGLPDQEDHDLVTAGIRRFLSEPQD
ncbi:heme-degrading domain-containing protein [Saccharibacillus sp. CPCC 101409]|uniref:heme-degrading domain-containing protein n=1 Tax=Saccharibacillus sp. CPCC 101409 TaxID=3058041 RepID=UPI002673B43E|nr:heme-degrading domain-containing protein [Saccharibacillus sp. CPCC 101409]MDO3411436.1 heme-degrading domain-containing protein [Saccharibacillus sp. CPCC 101409]